MISDGASNNTIGGLTTTPGTGAGNVISGNTDDGVQFNVQNTDSGPTDNLVAGNLIGTNAAGTAALGNGYDGVLIEAGATNNTIGGSTASALNIISGNINAGVEINDTNDEPRRGRLHWHRQDRDLCDWQRHGRRDRYERRPATRSAASRARLAPAWAT